MPLVQPTILNSNPSVPSPNLDFHVRPFTTTPVASSSNILPSLNPPLVDLLRNSTSFSPLGQSLATTLLMNKWLPAQSTVSPPSNFQSGMTEMLKGFDQTSKGMMRPCMSTVSDEEASQADTNAGSRCSPNSEDSLKSGKKSSATYLTEDQAREIYSLRPQAKLNKGASANFSYSRSLSSKYGVDARTLRDIWNRRTWVKATFDLWLPSEVE
eukprot:3933764-Rhodomonas_salina.1